MSDWFETLEAQVKAKSISQVAREIGYARPSVSLALNGKYPTSTKKIADAVLQTYQTAIACPYLKYEISPEECATQNSAHQPTHDPLALRFWNTCQTCEFNTKKKGHSK